MLSITPSFFCPFSLTSFLPLLFFVDNWFLFPYLRTFVLLHWMGCLDRCHTRRHFNLWWDPNRTDSTCLFPSAGRLSGQYRQRCCGKNLNITINPTSTSGLNLPQHRHWPCTFTFVELGDLLLYSPLHLIPSSQTTQATKASSLKSEPQSAVALVALWQKTVSALSRAAILLPLTSECFHVYKGVKNVRNPHCSLLNDHNIYSPTTNLQQNGHHFESTPWG